MVCRERGSAILCKSFMSARLIASLQCQGGDSNPYGFLNQILSLARLPIPPPRQIPNNMYVMIKYASAIEFDIDSILTV